MIELFWKNSSYVSSLSVCIFVAWCVQISVAGANKVEGTMSWCVRKQWDFGIWHYIHSAWGQTRAVWDRHVDCSQFFRLLLRLKVFRSMILKYLYDSNAEYRTVMVLFKGSYFSVGAASRDFWPNLAKANGTTLVFHNVWVLFHLLQGRV